MGIARETQGSSAHPPHTAFRHVSLWRGNQTHIFRWLPGEELAALNAILDAAKAGSITMFDAVMLRNGVLLDQMRRMPSEAR